jgi:Mn-dependent DtxR family transcriptional regulator
MSTEKRFMNAADVADYMGVSKPMAYKIIRKLNDELAEQGYITIAGKISRLFFEQKVYGATVS